MKTYVLTTQQTIPISLDEAWNFFSSPPNLAKITPADMSFEETSHYNGDKKMYAGMIITYKVSPILGIKLNWMTEIAHVKQAEYFVDEQRMGPFAFWHHQHHFKAIEGGVLMSDILHYALPFGIIGRLVNAFIVAKQVKTIFEFREKAVREMFGELVDRVK